MSLLNLTEGQRKIAASALTMMSLVIMAGILVWVLSLMISFFRYFSGVFLPLAVAAQEVQRSADGRAYEKWEGRALALTQALNNPSLIACRFHKFGTPIRTPTIDVIASASKEWGKITAKHSGRVITITSSQRTRVAIWFMTHASELGVTQLRWNQVEWDRYGISNRKAEKVATLTVTLQ